jgi:hypothetical protein
MRGVLVAVVVLALLAVGADYALTRAVEARVASEVEESMGGQAEVDLRGWPVSLGLLRGTVEEATIHATQVPIEETGGVLPVLDVVLTDIRLPPVAGGDPRALRAGSGRFVTRLDQEALTDLAVDAGAPQIGAVQISGDTLQVVIRGVAVDLTVAARDGALVVRPVNDLLARLTGGEQVVPVDGLPEGTRLDGARVEDGALVLSGPVDLEALVAGGSG